MVDIECRSGDGVRAAGAGQGALTGRSFLVLSLVPSNIIGQRKSRPSTVSVAQDRTTSETFFHFSIYLTTFSPSANNALTAVNCVVI